MVFGSVASASSCEPFRQAIECPSAAYSTNKLWQLSTNIGLIWYNGLMSKRQEWCSYQLKGVQRKKELWMCWAHQNLLPISFTLTTIYWQMRNCACTTLRQQVWKQFPICWDSPRSYYVSAQFCSKMASIGSHALPYFVGPSILH